MNDSGLQLKCSTSWQSRPVFVLEAPYLKYFEDWPVKGTPSCLVVILDRERLPPDPKDIFEFAHSALVAGARLVLTAGSAGDTLEDLFDEEVVDEKLKGILPSGETVLTVHVRHGAASDIMEAAVEIYKCPSTGSKDCPVILVALRDDRRLNEILRFLAQ